MTLAGVALGLAGAFTLTRFFAEFLDRVNPARSDGVRRRGDSSGERIAGGVLGSGAQGG